MNAKKVSGKKLVAVLLALVLVIGGTIGGTLAWLSATSETVTNTFTVGDVNIELKEHELVDGALTNTEVTEVDTYKVLPGTTQPKDPFVRVKANSEDSWIFVQVKEVNNTVGSSKYVTWEKAEGWTQLGETVNGVSTYYRTENYKTSADDVTYDVLKDNTVTYVDTLTKANIEALDKDAVGAEGHGTIETDEMPKLIFKAFAVQAEAGVGDNTTAAATAAWGQIATADKLS